MLSTNPVTANLIRARELIADERNWCVGSIKNRRGQMCAVGALIEVGAWGPEMAGIMGKAANEIAVGQPYYNPGDISNTLIVNNNMGHAATMRMFDRAIELSLASA